MKRERHGYTFAVLAALNIGNAAANIDHHTAAFFCAATGVWCLWEAIDDCIGWHVSRSR